MKIICALLITICLLSSCNSIANENSPYDNCKTNNNVNILENLSNLILFNEVTSQVKDDIPPFTFKAYGGKDDIDFVSELYIVDAETNALVCDLTIDGIWDAPGVPAEFYEIELIDVNFDGYKDIIIFGGPKGIWNMDYVYFIWNLDTGQFIDDKYNLRSLGLPSFDEENQLIHSMQRGSAADHWYYTHQYIGGKLEVIEEISDNCVWEHWLDDSAKEHIKALESSYEHDSTFMHFTKKQLDENTMELVVVEEKYVLFANQTKVAEYTSDSEIGMLLASYEKYRG